ncbi:hypothetical protein SAMN05444365_10450 [Micromonospora pattaloongensis]|uniref:Rho termination factor, N-terminal domain n=1 Tax=Micromonospora pattaloongensis TaxID=405436 RepID=A0A1H3NLW6_9ACTN|nr:hypothetical protein [Micromonospora pattaloongensis]SDY89743.1 hypothetical protein SAMN05444365_10450 [Micromonospora pattaloongensis]
MSDGYLWQKKTGEVVEAARRAGIQNPERKNKEQLLREMGQAPPESTRPGRGTGPDVAPPPGTSPQEWNRIPGNQS